MSTIIVIASKLRSVQIFFILKKFFSILDLLGLREIVNLNFKATPP